MNIGFVPVNEVDQTWPLVVENINAACVQEDSGISAGELWQLCRGGNAFLMIIHDGMTIYSASVWQFQPGNSLRCFILWGKEMRLWFDEAQTFVMRIAGENGVQFIRADGRKGWLRVFKGSVKNGEDCEVRL